MKKFKLILRYNSGYEQYKCLECNNKIAIPIDKENKNIVRCYYCGNKEKKKGD